jgi:hypothetical protein
MTVTTSAKIRLALPSDEPEILHLLSLMHAENAQYPVDWDCVRAKLARAWSQQGATIAVIGLPGQIRAMVMLEIGCIWYTRKCHVGDVFTFVHPDHRKSDYLKLLVHYARESSEKLSAQMGEKVPLVMGVVAYKRMAALVRLYRRFFGLPVVALFVYNASWVCKDEPCEEDLWRLPSMAKWLRRHSNGSEKRRIGA